VGGQYYAPAALTPRKETQYPFYIGWVGLGASLDVSGQSLSYWASNPGLSRP
jgi:hypothetical protein